MTKISIIGVGRVGSVLANSLLSNPEIDELLIIDKEEKLVNGLSLDLKHAYTELSHKVKIGSYSETEGSKIIIITAGIQKTGVNTRMDLLDVNKEVIKEIVQSIKLSDETILIIVTNPVEPLTFLTYKLTKIDPKHIIGFGSSLDSSRLIYFLSEKTNIHPNKIQGLVIGEHGENMIPVFSQCSINNKDISDYNLDIEEISYKLKNAGREIREMRGGTQFGPAKHIENLVNVILSDSNQTLPVSFYVEKNDFYGIENICVSLPAKVNFNGIGDIIEIQLNKEEKVKFKSLVSLLKDIQSKLQ